MALVLYRVFVTYYHKKNDVRSSIHANRYIDALSTDLEIIGSDTSGHWFGIGVTIHFDVTVSYSQGPNNYHYTNCHQRKGGLWYELRSVIIPESLFARVAILIISMTVKCKSVFINKI